ncbi:FecCD family ABC transporter permease [Falsirhodobacter sp. 20TX0035]|uniref:FecCD family ABC transporter permease n=1 Tax=Falsirhodobacter sp. 20TX0035 TaxID=3022019 RepID=UPI00232DE912|nr:iron ABC transporter permease [Falsirhodobacter sp. 20TX0035]MDB6454258.1 iron ABC transporter permease [Falsirhodobacter sp. 20TX0035]
MILRTGPFSAQVSRRFLWALPVLLAAVAALVWIAIGAGATPTTATERLSALRGEGLIGDLRRPRILVALLGGAMTAASGIILQTVSRNGLADPGLLGLSQGSVVAILIGGLVFGLGSGALVWVGLGGALAVSVLVLGLGRGTLAGGGIVLVGLAVNIVLGSVTEIVMTSGDATRFARLAVWSRGSLAGVSAGDLRLIAVWALVTVPLLLALSRHLAPLLLGHDAARGVGVDTRRLLPALVLLAAALSAPVVVVCGPISFLGLIAGYVARRLVGDAPTEVLVTGMILGGGILLLADTAGRAALAPLVVPAGLMTSVAGVVVFLLAIAADRRLNR